MIIKLTSGHLRLIQAAHGLEQQEFAKRVGISSAMASYLTNGVKPISDEMNSRILRAFDIDEKKMMMMDELLQHVGK